MLQLGSQIQMTRKLPVIRIKDAWLLRENVSKHLHELWGKDTELADDKWMKNKVAAYQVAWKPFEKKILIAMCDILGLDFRQNIIDVYIAPWFGAFSDPLVIGVIYEPDLFIDILTHELIHRLLTDNTSVPADTEIGYEWELLFGKKNTFTTLVHIPVHAVHKAIYLDIFKEPERYERDKARMKRLKAVEYVKSFEYVDEMDYKVIIEKLKKSYDKLALKNKNA